MSSEDTRSRVHKNFSYGRRALWQSRRMDEVEVSDTTSLDSTRYPLKQSTTSFRSESADSDDPYVLLAKQVEENQKSTYDNGHPFFTEKKTLHTFPRNVILDARSKDLRSSVKYFGTPVISRDPGKITDGNWSASAAQPDYDSIGNGFIKDTIPTKSAANLSLALAELLQDVPKIPFLAMTSIRRMSKSDIVRLPGNEYLNITFGWQPSIRDFQDICKAIFRSTELVEQYVRDAGALVRRSRTAPVSTSVKTDSFFGYMLGSPPNNFGSYRDAANEVGVSGSDYNTGLVEVSERVTDQLWFSGAYSYFLSNGDNLLDKAKDAEQIANYLLGTRLTIETAWNLLPFSWLLDWYANIGDIISVASHLGQDGLVLRYGYLMHKRVCETLYSMPDAPGLRLSGQAPLEIRTSYKYESKRRVRSTPYGFGLNTDSFSSKQWAILAALGMTRSPRALRY